MPPARSVNLCVFTGSVPSCISRHHLGTDGRARVDGERPIQRSWSIVARSTSGAPRERPASARSDCSRSKKDRRSVPVAVGGELRID
jgi:hypothetical protein